MTIRLTSADITEHLQQTQKGLSREKEVSTHIELPQGGGSLYLKVFSPSPEVSISLHQYKLQQELHLEEQPSKLYLGLTFCLSGLAQYQPHQQLYPLFVEPKLGILTAGSLPKIFIETAPGDPLYIMELGIASAIINSLYAESDGEILGKVMAIQDREFVSQAWQTDTNVQSLLHQLLNCPFQGLVKHLFLQAKGIELLALSLHQLLIHQEQEIFRLKSDDIERLYEAKRILFAEMEDPPSLLSLASQVGLSDWKLKRGFRELFGTTVFGLLHHHRLEQAYHILERGEESVTEVALSVGYASLGSFINAFKKQFGITPGSLTKRG